MWLLQGLLNWMNGKVIIFYECLNQLIERTLKALHGLSVRYLSSHFFVGRNGEVDKIKGSDHGICISLQPANSCITVSIFIIVGHS